uniref:Uncharacterized protein n=1 Tax=Schlesneria paludicola TaxID=360056 RepID=A0A7C2P679_9PLAN
MKLFTGLCASLLLVVSSVGCCCMSSCVSSCDPCGRELCGGGGRSSSCCGVGGCGLGSCLSRLFHPKCHKCHSMYAGYGWDAYAGCGDYSVGCDCGVPMDSGCACGQPHGMPGTMIPAAPPAQAAPAPVPGADPMSARPATRQPAVLQAATTAPRSTPQQVSYEEFQRLPGVVTSGPTSPAPASAPLMVPPVAGQPTNWSGTK